MMVYFQDQKEKKKIEIDFFSDFEKTDFSEHLKERVAYLELSLGYAQKGNAYRAEDSIGQAYHEALNIVENYFIPQYFNTHGKPGLLRPKRGPEYSIKLLDGTLSHMKANRYADDDFIKKYITGLESLRDKIINPDIRPAAAAQQEQSLALTL